MPQWEIASEVFGMCDVSVGRAVASVEELRSRIQRLLQLQGLAVDRIATLGASRDDISALKGYQAQLCAVVDELTTLCSRRQGNETA